MLTTVESFATRIDPTPDGGLRRVIIERIRHLMPDGRVIEGTLERTETVTGQHLQVNLPAQYKRGKVKSYYRCDMKVTYRNGVRVTRNT